MKVCAVSPWETAPARDILCFLGEATAELVVLPGVSRNTPSPQDVQRAIRRGVAVFVQSGRKKQRRKLKGKLGAIPYLVTRNRVVRMPCQIFSECTPTAKQMDELVKAWPKRTFSIGSRQVTFAICGEINGFTGDHVKHRRVLPFDILANPTHTVMGRWQHLGPKLEALSKGKVAIHVANNDRNHGHLTTDVRIYINETLQGGTVQRGQLKCCECDI